MVLDSNDYGPGRDGSTDVSKGNANALEQAGLIGRSPEMERLATCVRRSSDSDATVLVTGESGTGKELVARALHACSRRRGGPFVAINCAALPASLVESEFFGHARGAYTGATVGASGLFEQADGGTLFLDEVGEFVLAMQPKLLRALQERSVRPVGDQREIDFDVRLVAATNCNLEERVRQGRFREDLYYRLNVLAIHVPSLRERGDDVLVLAEHFIGLFADRSRRPVMGLSEDAKRLLLDHDWPGNVRELRSCVERAVALAEGPRIEAWDLPAAVAESSNRKQRLHSVVGRESLPSLSDMEWRYIHHVLERVDGNKSEAARVLGINRRTLHRKLGAAPPSTRLRPAADGGEDER